MAEIGVFTVAIEGEALFTCRSCKKDHTFHGGLVGTMVYFPSKLILRDTSGVLLHQCRLTRTVWYCAQCDLHLGVNEIELLVPRPARGVRKRPAPFCKRCNLRVVSRVTTSYPQTG